MLRKLHASSFHIDIEVSLYSRWFDVSFENHLDLLASWVGGVYGDEEMRTQTAISPDLYHVSIDTEPLHNRPLKPYGYLGI